MGTTRRRREIGIVAALSFLVLSASIFPESPSPSEQLKRHFIQDHRALDSAVSALIQAANTSGSMAQLRSSYLRCRERYKKVEYLSEYYAPHLHINRPFLPEINEMDREIEPPMGFGVLENMLYTQDTLTSLPLFRRELHFLRLNVASLKEITKVPQLGEDRYVFEAMRAEIVRISTLGITGYDTPETLTCLQESAIALQGVRACLQEYYPSLPAPLVARLELLFSGAILALEQGDFASFDRLHFIRVYANPLSTQLLETQNTLQIPISASKKHFVDYGTPHIFSPKALGKYTAVGVEPKERMELGKLLFFDPVLSGNKKRSCASCHQPQKAFTDGLTKSVAFDFQGTVERNAPSLLNACLQPTFFHDGRARSLEEQVGKVVENPKELGGNFLVICRELGQSKGYARLFKKAFGDSDTLITASRIKKAIAAFERSMIALNAPFDKYMAGDSSQLSAEQLKGGNLFMGKAQCATCHFAPLFNGLLPPDYKKMEAEVLGATADNNFLVPQLDNDKGRFAVTQIHLQDKAFKTPSVRNAALTAPYMHNGSLKSLEEVMEFYNKGGGKGLGLEVPNQTLPEKQLNLSKEEISAVIAFMTSLTDTSTAIKAPLRLPKIPGLERKVAGDY